MSENAIAKSRSVCLSVCHTGDARLTIQDNEICFAQYDRAMFVLILAAKFRSRE